jgi:glycosyltransferase involved in cell wall biosynthesis
MMKQQQFLVDFSLSLINRTGAYFVCRDVVQQLPRHFAATRYWRWLFAREPHGIGRKVLARLMLLEFDYPNATSFFPARPAHPSGIPTLFMDPLYVLRAAFSRDDIVLCHDVGPITHQDLFDSHTSHLYQAAYEAIRATKPGMVFVSEASRRDFVSIFGDDYRFLKVIPLYVRPNFTSGAEEAPKGVRKPFLLTVGALETRKNYARVIQAFQDAGLRNEGYSYVFCGPRGNAAGAIEELARATPGVSYLGYRSETELRWLYRNASGFVLPSLLEGFGIPALEAAQHGLLSVVGSGGAQKEAVGEGAILVDPTSVTDIAQGLRQFVTMPTTERLRKLALAREHASALSFEQYIDRWRALLETA